MSQNNPNEDSQTPQKVISFEKDIQPILQKQCYQCHGPEKQDGGLRLDSREHAEAGGNSQLSLLDENLETNPIYLRITSNEDDFRMPRDADPLSPEQIKLIADWIKQKTPWPVSEKPQSSLPQKNLPAGEFEEEPFIFRMIDQIVAFHKKYTFIRTLEYFACVLLILVAVVETFRKARKKQKTWTTGRAKRFVDFICLLRPAHFLVILLLVALIFSWKDFQHRIEAAKKVQRSFKNTIPKKQTVSVNQAFGSPPVPIRPTRPKQIKGTYYRGNCERSPKLYNGGNYRTATFYLGLYDSNQEQIELGDIVKPGKIYIRFEIERAPKTAGEFFSKKAMSMIYMTEYIDLYPELKKEASKPVRLENIEEEQRWAGFYPIGSIEEGKDETFSGLVYVASGKQDGDSFNGLIHYGIKYDIVIKDGKLHNDSDLWMGELFLSPVISPPTHGKVPIVEWFDYRPIPIIEGENSKDPKLLGIDKKLAEPAEPTKSAKPTESDKSSDSTELPESN